MYFKPALSHSRTFWLVNLFAPSIPVYTVSPAGIEFYSANMLRSCTGGYIYIYSIAQGQGGGKRGLKTRLFCLFSLEIAKKSLAF
ncbi:hypothetical protein [Bathymodiolus platifrons methanotrophic gill symbiont]|uniref:hypothetical protein n=1 Tax=Bathymodiolus platifrons methanotrophic gill symbiont TaxID=113268 RepID=UPI001C8E79DA|nr:hypothetical protein [Bathymodiolus platifrons methanotrophic gill symbiont]